MTIQVRLLIAALVLIVAVPAHAQTQPVDLADRTLEDLMNVEVTSASRKEQRAEDVPGAVYVITHEEIRRSGMNSVPDLLRLVPGVQVAQINSNKWAISVRGFNGLYSNKLLVLIDGRSVYNPAFSATFWDTEDLMLEDVDRIEVIRGPGGSVWGVNAVNGVINIMTRPAAETPGLLVRAGAGTFDTSNVAVRYGGTSGRGAYRAYGQLTTHGDSFATPQITANDHWRSLTSGFRGDWSLGHDAFMLQSSVTAGQERPLSVNLDPALKGRMDSSGVSDMEVGDVLGRWTHTLGQGASLQLQSFVDVAHRRGSIADYQRYSVDVDAVYHTTLGRRHDLVVGGGYRHVRELIDGGVGYSFTDSNALERLANAFVQDDISLAGRRVQLTLGAKVEHDTDHGVGLQPTARIMWNVKPRQRLWAAVSRALRTPSPVEDGLRIDFPPTIPAATPGAPPFPVAVSVLGNPLQQTESVVSTETGYRLDIGSRAAIDVAGFVNHYQHLQTLEPSAPSLVFVGGRPFIDVSNVLQNLLAADTRGAEITGRVALSDGWQVDGTFSAFHLTPHPDPASHDPRSPAFDGSAPSYQWRGHSALSLGPRAQTDVLLFYVGALKQLGIPAYMRVDLRFEWRLTRRISAIAQGQNLLSPSHAEFASNMTMIATQVPRSAGLRLMWRF